MKKNIKKDIKMNLQKQVRKDYTQDVEDRLVRDNDVTKVKKENYIMRR